MKSSLHHVKITRGIKLRENICHQNKKDTKIAVIEIDEGSIPRVLNEVTPTMMVVTNFFRDQMDRFGEIDIMVNNIRIRISIV